MPQTTSSSMARSRASSAGATEALIWELTEKVGERRPSGAGAANRA
jgi:hypothetical protein